MTGFDAPHNEEVADKPKKDDGLFEAKEKKEVPPVKQLEQMCMKMQRDLQDKMKNAEHPPAALECAKQAQAELIKILEQNPRLVAELPEKTESLLFIDGYLEYSNMDASGKVVNTIEFDLSVSKYKGEMGVSVRDQGPVASDSDAYKAVGPPPR